MRFIRSIQQVAEEGPEDDPMSGVAQLFDVSIAFIVAVIAAMFTLLSTHSITRPVTNKSGEKTLSGNGVRLGTAYKLDNGQVVYVPDTTKHQ